MKNVLLIYVIILASCGVDGQFIDKSNRIIPDGIRTGTAKYYDLNNGNMEGLVKTININLIEDNIIQVKEIRDKPQIKAPIDVTLAFTNIGKIIVEIKQQTGKNGQDFCIPGFFEKDKNGFKIIPFSHEVIQKYCKENIGRDFVRTYNSEDNIIKIHYLHGDTLEKRKNIIDELLKLHDIYDKKYCMVVEYE